MKVLINSGPGIGDIVQFLSLAKAIKENDNCAKIDLIIKGNKVKYHLNQQLLMCQNYIDKLYWYSIDSPAHNLKLILELISNRYDYGIVRLEKVHAHYSKWIYYLIRMANCKKVVVCSFEPVEFGDIKIKLPERIHYLKRNELFLKAIGIESKCSRLTLAKKDLDTDWIDKQKIRAKTIIAFSIGTNAMSWKEYNQQITYDVKSWEYSKWICLAEELAAMGFAVILLGGIKEKKELENNVLILPDVTGIYNYVGRTNILQSLSLLSICNLAVGAEGGMMHCASSLGIDTLTIFGGSDYKMWNPGGEHGYYISLEYDCSPCFCTSKAAHCKSKKCLSDITVEMVKEKILDILNIK